MRRLPTRTSITKDEAVSILLGRSTGPIELESVDDTAEADANRPSFCLRETLEDELDVLEGEYDLAKYENKPAHVIGEKLAALQRQEAELDKAYAYLGAIDDELNKGGQSVLKVDSALTDAAFTYVSLHSFNQWREGIDTECLTGQEPGAEVPAALVPASTRTKRTQQEDAILAEIQKQGFDPMSLPPNCSGYSGAKKVIRKSLQKSPLFKGWTTFDKAWERLRGDPARIAYSAEPSSPKKI